MFVLFKYLHILAMFLAVATAFVPEIWLQAVARRGDIAGLRGFMPLAERVAKLIPVLFVLGLIFGLLAAFAGELNFLAPWLIAAYVVFAIAMATGALLSEPWASRLGKALEANAGDSPSPELTAAIRDRRGAISTAILMTAIVVILWLMVAKPGA